MNPRIGRCSRESPVDFASCVSADSVSVGSGVGSLCSLLIGGLDSKVGLMDAGQFRGGSAKVFSDMRLKWQAL